jgi:hypothetical protein
MCFLPTGWGIIPILFGPVRLPYRWIGRGVPKPWPATSQDLSPRDFFFWAVAKDSVYRQMSHSLPELRDWISDAAAQVDAAMVQRT